MLSLAGNKDAATAVPDFSGFYGDSAGLWKFEHKSRDNINKTPPMRGSRRDLDPRRTP
jgi:hypothetical protein